MLNAQVAIVQQNAAHIVCSPVLGSLLTRVDPPPPIRSRERGGGVRTAPPSHGVGGKSFPEDRVPHRGVVSSESLRSVFLSGDDERTAQPSKAHLWRYLSRESYRLGWLTKAPWVGQSFLAERLGITLTAATCGPPQTGPLISTARGSGTGPALTGVIDQGRSSGV